MTAQQFLLVHSERARKETISENSKQIKSNLQRTNSIATENLGKIKGQAKMVSLRDRQIGKVLRWIRYETVFKRKHIVNFVTWKFSG